jgi:hypothetical protein
MTRLKAGDCLGTAGRVATLVKGKGTPAFHSLAARTKSAVFPVLLWLIGSLAASGAAYAAPPQTPAISLYQGQGVDANLVDVLPKLFKGDLRFEKAYFTGLGYFHPFETPRFLRSVFDFLHVPGTNTGFEVIAAKHTGLQHTWEADVAYAFRFSGLTVSSLTVRFGVDLGLSYAFGRPTYEDGPKDDPDRRYRFQHYGAYEVEWGHASAPRVSLVTRIHHRSGIYGVIAPRRVGSNFMTLGIRYAF